MIQEKCWQKHYEEIIAFIETNKRNPSKYNAEERGEYYTWLKHNRKQMNAGTMKAERVVLMSRFIRIISFQLKL